jgi:hypothetical protein
VDHEAHVDGAPPPDPVAVSPQWARVSDAIRATVRAWVEHARRGAEVKRNAKPTPSPRVWIQYCDVFATITSGSVT